MGDPEQEIYRQIPDVLFFGILDDYTDWFQIRDSQGLRFAAKALVACALFFKQNLISKRHPESSTADIRDLLSRFAERLEGAHRALTRLKA